ncbi:MAG: hypothetical protein ABIC91_03425 [Nanoarchaeota archaeon]|nr:hypothetical protein [Nanoarchaeota archaeon]MBU1030024.1 hypothetical protein [Nanoarchaeota archaeon]MBU1849966.1 hypothetical protein [Nanoarchaeota archaeon]
MISNLKEIVNLWAENYKTNKRFLPEVSVLENELYSISGIDRSDPSGILLIPIDSKDLQFVGSACGTIGNKIFSNKSIVSFLKNRGVKEFLGIIYDPNADDTYERQVISLNSAALPIVGTDGHIFESLVSKNNGSFRYEKSKVLGWSVYESE